MNQLEIRLRFVIFCFSKFKTITLFSVPLRSSLKLKLTDPEIEFNYE